MPFLALTTCDGEPFGCPDTSPHVCCDFVNGHDIYFPPPCPEDASGPYVYDGPLSFPEASTAPDAPAD